MTADPEGIRGVIGILITIVIFVVHLLTAARAITRPDRQPAARIAWIAVIMCLPVLGVLAYWFLGETSIGRKRVERLRDAERRLAAPAGEPAEVAHESAAAVSRLVATINGFEAVAGNRIELLGDPDAPASEPKRDSNAAVDALVEAIDGAQDHVHISFYIWLDDTNGARVADAVCAAARRGVTCRIMADALGSRKFVRTARWRSMGEAGAHLVVTLEDVPRLGHLAVGRVDLRNHRKIVVIDNGIAFVGSQNCADPEFRVKPKFAPWIDILLRCEGPVARQAQHLFLSGWIVGTGEDLFALPAAEPAPAPFEPGVVAQMFGTGPTTSGEAMSESFVATLYSATRELVITTPYLVPDEAMLRALCAAPRRGVDTTLIVPAHNDSALVGAASRSVYPDLIAAGVKLYEYPLGLLHTKSITVDRRFALVGSANMDRRSLQLNFENNLLLFDEEATESVRRRQLGYLSQSHAVTAEDAVQSPPRRLADNVAAMLAPLL